jgi:hypothetical protein
MLNLCSFVKVWEEMDEKNTKSRWEREDGFWSVGEANSVKILITELIRQGQ